MRFVEIFIIMLFGLNAFALDMRSFMHDSFKDSYRVPVDDGDIRGRSLVNYRWIPWFGRPIDK